MIKHPRKIHTIHCLIGLRVSSCGNQITAAEGLLDHAGMVICEFTVHIDLFGGNHGQNGGEDEG